MSSTQNKVWPLPKFYFQAVFDGTTPSGFQEVTGLESAPRPVHGRTGTSAKAPGGRVILQRGVVRVDPTLRAWFAHASASSLPRRQVVIHLLDEAGQPAMTWTLENARPTKVTGSDLTSEGNEVAVESIEIAYETLVISAP